MAERFKAGPKVEIAFLGDGETKIELLQDSESAAKAGMASLWGFEVDSLDRALAMVKEKGIAVTGGPVQPNPHVRFFMVRDPDGLTVQLVENIK